MCTIQYSHAEYKNSKYGFVLVFHCHKFLGIYSEKFLRNSTFSILPLPNFWVLFSFAIAHSCVKKGRKVERRYFMQQIQWIMLGILKLTFLVKIWFLITPGGPLGPENSSPVVGFRPKHLNLIQRNPWSWYQQPADHLEGVLERYCKTPNGNWQFWGICEKPNKNGHMALQFQDMVLGCLRS